MKLRLLNRWFMLLVCVTEASRSQVTCVIARRPRPDEEILAIGDRGRRRRDRRPRSLKEVRRREELDGRAAPVSAAREHASVRQQKRGGVVAAVDGIARHRGPLPGRRVPDLGREGRGARVRVRVLGPAAAAGREHPPVGQDRQVVVLAREIHRPRRLPDGRAGREVDDLRRLRRRNGGSAAVERPVDAAGDQDPARRIHRGRTPVARPEGVVAHDAPRAGPRRVQVARRRARPRVEDPAVRGEEHVRVVRLLKLRARQGAPGVAARLEHLGKRIRARSCPPIRRRRGCHRWRASWPPGTSARRSCSAAASRYSPFRRRSRRSRVRRRSRCVRRRRTAGRRRAGKNRCRRCCTPPARPGRPFRR